MKNNNKRKKKTLKSKKTIKNKRKRRPSKKSLQNSKNSTKPSQFGWERLKTSLKKNTLDFIRVLQTIGKTIWPSNSFQSKEVLNSDQSSSSPRELHSICSKPRRRRTISSSTLEESSSWTTVKTSSPNIWASSEVLSILKISHWTSPDNIFNTTRSLRLSERISSRNV